MNRRGFLRFLVAAPVVGPAVVKALASIPTGPFSWAAHPAAWARSFVTPSPESLQVKLWAQHLWLDMPQPLYWGRFMSDRSEGTILTFTRERKLADPS